MLSAEEVKKLTRKEFTNLLRQICTEFASELYFKHDVDFIFDHYDGDLKVVYVRESENTKNPVTNEILSGLLAAVKKLNSRMQVGIFFEDTQAGDS
jgi:hypothetical protein